MRIAGKRASLRMGLPYTGPPDSIVAGCPTVLIGGLGLGYTVRQALDMLRPDATVLVAELVPDIIRWNRDSPTRFIWAPYSPERKNAKT